MGKIYAMMLSTTDDLFQEEIWTSLSDYVEKSDNRLYFFCGKPLGSTLDDEIYNNIIFNLMKDLPMEGLISLTGSLNHYIGIHEFQKVIHHFGDIPKVSISVALDGCSNVLLDNYGSSYKLAEHLISHNPRKTGVIVGPRNTPESIERYCGTLDAFVKMGNDIPIIEQGDFSKSSGYLCALNLLKEGVETIICANDQMALGAYEAIFERGLAIPKDVKVVGFDDIEQAKLLEVPLTTIRQPFDMMAKSAYDLLVSGSLQTIKHTGEIVYRQSCGCESKDQYHEEEMVKNRYYMDKYHDSIKEYNQTLQMHGKFDQVNSLEKLNQVLETYLDTISGTEFHLCLFENFKQKIENPSTFAFPKTMKHQFGYVNGLIFNPSIYFTNTGLPQEVFSVSPSKSALVYPVNLHDVSYGYIVSDAKTAKHKNFTALRQTIVNVLNRIDMYQQVEEYSKKMEQLALLDSMTGLYNRRGFFSIAELDFQKQVKNGKSPSIIFCDVNGLKKVNDNYGHAIGDQMIVETSNILKQVFKDDTVARIGGDEFIIYQSDSFIDTSESVIQALTRAMIVSNKTDKVPFVLSLEAGIARYDATNPVSLDELISQADKCLYSKKSILQRG